MIIFLLVTTPQPKHFCCSAHFLLTVKICASLNALLPATLVIIFETIRASLFATVKHWPFITSSGSIAFPFRSHGAFYF